jgi:hypothetical protein
VIIRNQCSDFELAFLVYFGRNVIWYMPPDQKVNVNTMIRASFGKNAARKEFASALIYRLQRKRLESNEYGISTNHQLLVIWRSDNRYKYLVQVLLIKHDNTTTLDEDKLKKLGYSPLTLLRTGRILRNVWLLDDAKVLITSDGEKRIRTIKITISKGTRENGCMKPLWISSDM